MVKAAISQKPPALLDLNRSLEIALGVIDEASASGAELLVFPEAFLPGYPSWIWRLRPEADRAIGNEIHARLRQNAVNLARHDLAPLQDAARDKGMVLVVGFNEVDAEVSGTTLFNSVAIIGPNRQILNRHRKLMPTNPERMVWGQGDGQGLRVVDTPVGRIGALLCWESYMPLARYAMYAQNIEIYVAPTWDYGETWLASMKHVAREGGCWVLSSATAMQGADVPPDFPGRDLFVAEDEWINPGDAVIVKPSGGLAAGPLHREKSILYAKIDLELARQARKSLDVTGHYARPDIFHLEVDRQPKLPVSFS